MGREDVWKLLRQRPFEPFRLFVSDGAVYEIWHPEIVAVERTTALIGTSAVGRKGILGRYDTVALLHITRFEPLPLPAPGNGVKN